ncbi:hypothetical protein HYQ46_013246 [Verticillium longisporum]|nr:hypothetical protein HYQ46_013246 [Verticillium longisporum]
MGCDNLASLTGFASAYEDGANADDIAVRSLHLCLRPFHPSVLPKFDGCGVDSDGAGTMPNQAFPGILGRRARYPVCRSGFRPLTPLYI